MTKSIYFPITFVWLLIALAVLTLAHFYPFAHYGYNYYGIAYSMWVKHVFWYPVWIDEINVQKTPLFYWLTLLCWRLFGISNLAMPAIILICYLLTAIFTAKACFVLSNCNKAAKMAGLLVLINATFVQYVNLIRFDIQLTFCFIMAFYSLTQIYCNHKIKYGWLYSLANVLGILFKGPVILLFTVPAALLGFLMINLPSLNPSKIHQPVKLKYLNSLIFFTLLAIGMSLIWFIPANIHSHGIYLHTILSQTLQRFNHEHPDPNLPQLTVHSYHWWYSLIRLVKYWFSILITPFVFILPLIAVRMYFSTKIPELRSKAIYLMVTTGIPSIFFAAFVGLMRTRYVLPTIPLVCILLAYLTTSIDLSENSKKIENMIYKIYLILLLVIAVVLLLLTLLPLMRPNFILFLVIALGFLILFLLTWKTQDFSSRWNKMILSSLLFIYLFLGTALWHLQSYPTLSQASHQLQKLSLQHQPLIDADYDTTREGWTQFLARDLSIKVLSSQSFNQFVNKNHGNIWMVYTTVPQKFKFYAKAVYPLEFFIQSNRPVPVLMPYSVYKKIVNIPGQKS